MNIIFLLDRNDFHCIGCNVLCTRCSQLTHENSKTCFEIYFNTNSYLQQQELIEKNASLQNEKKEQDE